MFWKAFKSKIFWIIWGIISIIGMFVGIYLTNEDENRVNNAVKCHANIYGEFKYIYVITDNNYLDEYLKFINKPTKYLPFPLKTLKYNQEVLVLDTIENSEIVEIKYYSNVNNYASNSIWQTALIHNKYLNNCDYPR